MNLSIYLTFRCIENKHLFFLMPLEGFVRPTETRESSIPLLYVSLCIGTIILCQGLWARYLKMIYCPPQRCCKNPWIIKVWFYYTRALKRGVHVVTWGWRHWAPHHFFSPCLHLSSGAKKLCSKVKIRRSQEKRGWKRRKQGGMRGKHRGEFETVSEERKMGEKG